MIEFVTKVMVYYKKSDSRCIVELGVGITCQCTINTIWLYICKM